MLEKVTTEPTWEDEVEKVAQKFSRELEDLFNKHNEIAKKKVPHLVMPSEKTDYQMRSILQHQIMLDYAIGTVLALVTKLGGVSSSAEEQMVKIVRSKWAVLRSLNEKGLYGRRE